MKLSFIESRDIDIIEGSFPDVIENIKELKKEFNDKGVEDLYLSYDSGTYYNDYRDYGLDISYKKKESDKQIELRQEIIKEFNRVNKVIEDK